MSWAVARRDTAQTRPKLENWNDPGHSVHARTPTHMRTSFHSETDSQSDPLPPKLRTLRTLSRPSGSRHAHPRRSHASAQRFRRCLQPDPVYERAQGRIVRACRRAESSRRRRVPAARTPSPSQLLTARPGQLQPAGHSPIHQSDVTSTKAVSSACMVSINNASSVNEIFVYTLTSSVNEIFVCTNLKAVPVNVFLSSLR